MSYSTKYAQRQGSCSGHWKGKPSGSSYSGSGCWCCAKGCFALCTLAIKGREPDETNIKSLLNSSADVDYSKAGITMTSKPTKYPCIGKIPTGSHYVIVTGYSNSSYNVWDPNGGVSKTMSSLASFYNVN